MALKLDPSQSQTLDSVLDWAENSADGSHGHGSREFLIHGRAGTGKTTLIRHLARFLGEDCLVLAPTNKAASNLRQKGIIANTIHSLLYVPQQKGTSEQIEQARKRLATFRKHTDDYNAAYRELRELQRVSFVLRERDADDPLPLAIVDECSMVSTAVGTDLAALVSQIVAFGDPWQLPPVKARAYFRSQPTATLSTIHRQGARSGILSMAETAYKTGRVLTSYGDEARVIAGAHIEPERYLKRLAAADQVLCGTNATRRALNHALRAHNNQPPVPEVGDTLVCVRSPDRDARELGLVNGFEYTVDASKIIDTELGLLLKLRLIEPIDDTTITYRMPLRQFLLASLPRDMAGIETLDDDYPGNPPLDFTNALTVHKAQGSEWRTVVVQNESWVFRSDDKRWLYTAITRAQERVTVLNGKPPLPRLPARYVRDYLSLLRA